MIDLSKLLKDRRVALDISQTDLAEISGVGLATVKDIERGAGNPSVATIEKILFTLGLETGVQLITAKKTEE